MGLMLALRGCLWLLWALQSSRFADRERAAGQIWGPNSFSGTAGAPGLVGDFATPCLSFPRAMVLSIQVLPACSCAIVLTLARCWGSSA